MGSQDKAIKRLKQLPSDYTFKEAQSLLISLGYKLYNKGKTSGSRVAFIRGNDRIILHKPHPKKELPKYATCQLKEKLEEIGDI